MILKACRLQKSKRKAINKSQTMKSMANKIKSNKRNKKNKQNKKKPRRKTN